jgi:hypothetical protein
MSDELYIERVDNAFTMADYERLLVARYVNGGHTGETASHFARGEIRAILVGNHWTHGKPTAPDPQRFIIERLSLSPNFAELAGKYEYDAGMIRSDAEARAATETLTALCREAPDPSKPRIVYHDLAALRRMTAAGIGLKDFYAKSKDNEPDSYTISFREIAEAWEQGTRRFKAFVRGRFLVLDIDRKPGKTNGLEIFYRLFPRETMPEALRDIPGTFPCYVTTPSGGYHLYFRYDGPELKLRELAPAIEVKEWQIIAPGSVKENGAYVLHGELSEAPPLYGVILERIENVKQKQARQKEERQQHTRPRAVADRPVRFDRPRITLDDLSGEAASVYAGHHDRQVSFAGRACRCKFSGAETLAYVKANPEIFGSGSDTETTILSVFRDNGGGV